MDRSDQITCFNCGRMLPYDVMVPGEMLRSALMDTIRKRHPEWTPAHMICVNCLDLYRSEYVEEALQEEVGNLTHLEEEVVTSMKEQETLTENHQRIGAQRTERQGVIENGLVYRCGSILPFQTPAPNVVTHSAAGSAGSKPTRWQAGNGMPGTSCHVAPASWLTKRPCLVAPT